MLKNRIKMKNLKRLYLKQIEQHGIIPNFFCSETYLDNTSIVGRLEDGWVWLEENGLVLFPALPLSDKSNKKYPISGCWADFENYTLFDEAEDEKKFLDLEFIYDTSEFNNLSGSKWRTFKKNIRYWPDVNIGWKYEQKTRYSDRKDLLVDWLERNQESVQDYETIVRCILEPTKNDLCKGLYNGQGELVSINFADENYKYINYRYIICKNEPYLDEFSRYCFYMDYDVRVKNKLINDGGCLGREGLKRFKIKLNPIKVRTVYSHKLKQYED